MSAFSFGINDELHWSKDKKDLSPGSGGPFLIKRRTVPNKYAETRSHLTERGQRQQQNVAMCKLNLPEYDVT
jgi:hypothetical protein